MNSHHPPPPSLEDRSDETGDSGEGLPGVVRAYGMAFAQPRTLGELVRVDGSFRTPLFVALISSVIVQVGRLLWDRESFALPPFDGSGDPPAPVSLPVAIVMACAGVVVGLAIISPISAGLVYVFGRITKLYEARYRCTLQCVYLAQAVGVVGVVPIIGAWVGTIWFWVAAVLMLSSALRTTWVRAALGVFVPTILVGILVAVMVFMVSIAMMMGSA